MSNKTFVPTEEQFNEWRGSPVAEWFFGELSEAPAKVREKWAVFSFDNGSADPYALSEMRGKAQAFYEVSQASFHGMVEVQDD